MMGRCPKCDELLIPQRGNPEGYWAARAEICRRIEEGTWWPKEEQ